MIWNVLIVMDFHLAAVMHVTTQDLLKVRVVAIVLLTILEFLRIIVQSAASAPWLSKNASIALIF